MNTRATVGGTLDMAALARMHFSSLDREEQAAAIRRLAATGMGDHGIADASGLSVEMVRRVLADQVAA
jgi:ABC-type phosphate/phosphonate transport system ATPase subunit